MRAITVRGISDFVYEALRREGVEKGMSINKVIVSLLDQATTPKAGQKRYDDLEELFGTWSEKRYEEFKRSIEIFEEVDQELWR
jgi:hypothetical protein